MILIFYLFNFLNIATTYGVNLRIIEQEVVYKDGYAFFQVEFFNASNSSIVLYDVCPLVLETHPYDDYDCDANVSGFFSQLSSTSHQKIDYNFTMDSKCVSLSLTSAMECYKNRPLTDYAIVILQPNESRRFQLKVCLQDYVLNSVEYELRLIYNQNANRFIKHKLTKNRSDLVTFSGCLFSNKVKLIKP
jgi:hypothetical protein